MDDVARQMREDLGRQMEKDIKRQIGERIRESLKTEIEANFQQQMDNLKRENASLFRRTSSWGRSVNKIRRSQPIRIKKKWNISDN